MLSFIILLLTVAAGVQQSVAFDSAETCQDLYAAFYKTIHEPETLSVNATDTFARLSASISPLIQSINSVNRQDILKSQNEYLDMIDPKIHGSAAAKDAITAAVTDSVSTIDVIFNNMGENIEQSYHDAVMDFLSKPDYAPEDIKNLTLFPLYTIKTDFIRLCRQSLTNIETASVAVKQTVRRIHSVFKIDPKREDSVPRSSVPIVRPYVLGTLSSTFYELQKNKTESTFPQQIISVCADSLTQIKENVSKQLDNMSTFMKAFLTTNSTGTTLKKGDVEQLATQIADKLDDNRTDNEDWFTSSVKDMKESMPETYEENSSQFWELATAGQKVINLYVDKCNDMIAESLQDAVNLYEAILGISV